MTNATSVTVARSPREISILGRRKKHDVPLSTILHRLYRKHSFYLETLSGIEKLCTPYTQTMAVAIIQGRYKLIYHPEWYKYCTLGETAAVLAHEAGHILMEHVPRYIALLLRHKGDKLKVSRIRRCFGVAADFCVNAALRNAGAAYTLPEGAVYAEQYGYPDDSDRSFEFYIMDMVRQMEEAAAEREEQQSLKGDEPGDGTGTPEKDTTGNSDLDQLLDRTEDDHAQEELEKLVEDLTSDDEAVKRQAIDDLNQMMDQAEDASEELKTHIETAGVLDYPGRKAETGAEAVATPAATRQQDWKPALFKWLKRYQPKKESGFVRNAMNMRGVTLRNPAMLYGVHKPVTAVFNILVGFDVSGSMDPARLSECMNVINTVSLSTELQTVMDVLEFDTRIMRETRVLDKKPPEFFACRGGGTDINCVFEYAKLNAHKKYDALVICTDAESGSIDREYYALKIPTAWVLVPGGMRTPPATFGTTFLL